MKKRILSTAVWNVLTHILPAKWYISLRYRVIYHKWISWDNPKVFSEKIQWLKLNDFRPEYVDMVDKVKVKDYITEKLGGQYVVPLLGVWKSAKDIDFNSLPDKFVLKCNHDSGTSVVCADKTSLDIDNARMILDKSLKSNYYLSGKEKPYKYVERRVFAESFLVDTEMGEVLDYKFYCFNGEPRILKIDYGRTVEHHANFYDIDMNRIPLRMRDNSPTPRAFPKPVNYAEMVDIARKLSDGIPFLRVDLYNIGGKLYFGELTLYPNSGFNPFADSSWDVRLGEWLSLPSKN